MAMASSPQLLALGLLLVGLRIVLGLVTQSRQNASAKALGCEPVPLANPGAWFGFRTMRSLLAAFVEKMIPMWYLQQLDALGRNVHTADVKVLMNRPIITRDENNIRAVLSTQFDDWRLGALKQGIFQRFGGPSVLTMEGEMWKHARSLIRPALNRESISNLAMYEKHAQDLFINLHTDAYGWTEVVDLQRNFYAFSLDVITEMLYGFSVHGQNPQKRSQLAADLGNADIPDAQGFVDGVNQAADLISYTALFGKLHRFAPTLKYFQVRRAVLQYPAWFIHRRLDAMSRDKTTLEQTPDERFILLNELSKVLPDAERLRSETIGLLVAGRGATSGLMSWTIYHLARHPEVFNKLRAIILSEFGEDFDVRRTGLLELRNCRYLQYVINEVLRIASPLPMITREAAKDTTLPSGGGPDGKSPIFVPKGTTVALNFFGMHHRTDIWGDDVEEFRPERWEKRKIDWSFMPFSGGARKCAGGK